MGGKPDTASTDKLNKLLSTQVENEERIAYEKKQELGREELLAIKAQSGGTFSGAAPTQADYTNPDSSSGQPDPLSFIPKINL